MVQNFIAACNNPIGPSSRQESSEEVPPASTLAPSGTAYYGATHWAAFLNHVRDIKTAIEKEEAAGTVPNTLSLSPPELSPVTTPGNITPDPIFGKVESITLRDVMDSLGCRQDVDKLLAIYFRCQYVVSSFIHVPRFQREYERFRTNPESTSFLWISILFSILANASMIAKAKGYDANMSMPIPPPALYTARAMQCLVAGQYLTDKKYAVEALLLYVHTRNVASQDSNAALWAIFGLATRLAQRGGYHRDPKHLSRRISPFETEMRRRVWFFVEAFDVLLSLHLGVPTIIHEEETDTDFITNHPDEDFDEDTETMPPPRPPLDPTPILSYSIKAKSIRIMRRVMRHALSTKKPDYDKTWALHAEIQQSYSEIPACLQYRPIQSTSFSEPNETIMFRLTHELMYNRAMCLLHRPYLTFEKDRELHRPSRKICSESARRILDLHVEYDREIRPGGRLYEDRYMFSVLTMHEFMVAAMVVCLDLNESAPARHAIHRMRAVQAIWNERASTSRDARHASIVLSAMLQRVGTRRLVDMSSRELPGWQATVNTGSIAVPTNTRTEDIGSAFDVSYDFLDFLPLDNAFNDPANLDWNLLDQWLHVE
ncbi:hypothetical protein jhhlp_005456 [Lomentospora prolificans]|uniref:Xylanolytic transcriptional activator regulatory domain-containing protein n=1 Tax=Lomentospora prolificans TaxID=41688 RepID=A0A2N3N6V4_9PEZI|nr:hypothetical protein jhhlp_005456 [Lomentospora prolificans]